MLKDYARQPQRRPSKKSGVRLLMLTLALLVPLVIVYYKMHQRIHHQKSPTLAQTKLPVSHPVEPIRTAPPDYDFYTLLPSMEVKVTAQEIQQNSNNPAWRDKAFILQVASLSSVSSAVKLRKKLKKQGLKPFIEEFQHRGKTYYRVMIGPYQGLHHVEKIQHQLKQHQLSSIILRLRQPQ